MNNTNSIDYEDIISNQHLPKFFCDDLTTTPILKTEKILVTGATGYVGGRLVRELLHRNYNVRVMVRKKSDEQTCIWPGAEIVLADALHKDSLELALNDVHTAYYLIHSLAEGPKLFAEKDITAANNFRKIAEKSNVKRIVYLGGLGGSSAVLSDHLQSRKEVEEELKAGTIPVTIFRAAIIIGSGSASYEIIQHLIKNSPIILLPNWATNLCQPIAIRDVMKYLVSALENNMTINKTYDIGSPDILTYKNMLKIIAEINSLKRFFIPVPTPNITFFSYIASLVTPVPAGLIQCLFYSLKNDVVCENDLAKKEINFEPLSFKDAIIKAIARERQDEVYTRWTDQYPIFHDLQEKLDDLNTNPRYTCTYSLNTNKDPAKIYKAFCAVGGKEGWFHQNWLWRLRGIIDRILLGVGSSRGRRSALTLKTNDVIDFWRVEDMQLNQRLLLRAEMKLPGKAWLEFKIKNNVFFVTAYYDTNSIWGKLYWYICYPFHHFIFTDLLKQIDAKA